MLLPRLFIRLYKCVLRAMPRSLSICLWLFKVMLPISLVVRVLQYVGIIDWLAGYLSPIFSYIGLSGDSAIVFLTSIFLPLYPTIAVMTTLTLTLREATILAVIHTTVSYTNECFLFVSTRWKGELQVKSRLGSPMRSMHGLRKHLMKMLMSDGLVCSCISLVNGSPMHG